MFMRRDRAVVIFIFSAVGFALGCAGLIPPKLKYQMQMEPLLPEGRGDYYIDLEDSSLVFSKEGALIKIKHVTDDQLNQQFPVLFDGRHVNPYTHEMKDPDKGYIPPRFTVFQVTVINMTYAKIEFDPVKSILITDTGENLRYYDPGRKGTNPLGGNTFSEYYRTELGISGNEKELNLERMGVVYKTVYHRHRPIFKESQFTGFLVFDTLPERNQEIAVKINEFVLSFDASGNPENTVDVEFRFKVDQGVIKVAEEISGA